MKRRRVKITGIGPVTPAGIGREEFWREIQLPVSRIRPFTNLGEEYGEFVAGFIEKFSIRDYVDDRKLPKGIARHTQFAVAAAVLALKDAGIDVEELRERNLAVVGGSSLMDFEGIGKTVEGVTTKGVRGALARTVYTTNASVIPATIVEALRLNARTLAIQTSCCAGIDAIGHAARMISNGEVDIAVCGGTEAPLFRCPLVELRATGLTPATSENAGKIDRPFDRWRTTGVVSEGATMLVLESEGSPREPYCFLEGYAFATDGQTLCSGMADAIRHALAEARIRVSEVGLINAWGPGHGRIDSAESAALMQTFADRLSQVPAFSIKGAIGNPLGAAAAIQVAVSALAHKFGVVPPTVNWEFPDPSCPLNLSARSRHLECDSSIVNAHGLSGVNSCIVLKRS